jgi:hypothetical protein
MGEGVVQHSADHLSVGDGRVVASRTGSGRFAPNKWLRGWLVRRRVG